MATWADADNDRTRHCPVRLTAWRTGSRVRQVLFLNPSKEVESLAARRPAPETPRRRECADLQGASQTLTWMSVWSEMPRRMQAGHRGTGDGGVEADRLSVVALCTPRHTLPSAHPPVSRFQRVASGFLLSGYPDFVGIKICFLASLCVE